MENPELTEEINEMNLWMKEHRSILESGDDHSKEKYRGEFAVIRMLEEYPEMKKEVCVNCGKSKIPRERHGIKAPVCVCDGE